MSHRLSKEQEARHAKNLLTSEYVQKSDVASLKYRLESTDIRKRERRSIKRRLAILGKSDAQV